MVTPNAAIRTVAVTTEIAIKVRVMTGLSVETVVGRGAEPTTFFARTTYLGSQACGPTPTSHLDCPQSP